ncbi:hypothetical protein CE195_08990 [Sodalis-like symbiont of Philaenus spumarius]|nr:hypothetical protein CE195_08990 [Sodalis-like symbiont of Philaenus spumarius]
MVLGHNHPAVRQAVLDAVQRGRRCVSVANIRSTIFYETALTRAAKPFFFKRQELKMIIPNKY